MQISRGSCKLVYILLSKIVTSNIQNYFCITYTDKNIFDNSYENRSKQFCSTRAGNLGNVLLTSRNCQKYFYQCGYRRNRVKVIFTFYTYIRVRRFFTYKFSILKKMATFFRLDSIPSNELSPFDSRLCALLDSWGQKVVFVFDIAKPP